MIGGEPVSIGPSALRALIAEGAAPVRKLLDRVEDWNLGTYLRLQYQVVFQMHALNVALREETRDGPLDADARVRYGTPLEMGLEGIVRNPAGYADLTGRHYLSFWSPGGRHVPSAVTAYDRLRERKGDLPYATVLHTPGEEPRTWILAWPVQQVFRGVGLASLTAGAGLLAMMAFSIAWRSSAVPLAGTLGIALHGYALLVAMTNTGAHRYLVGIWPLIAAFAIVILHIASRGWREARRGAKTPSSRSQPIAPSS